jgi:hypothetical protein
VAGAACVGAHPRHFVDNFPNFGHSAKPVTEAP